MKYVRVVDTNLPEPETFEDEAIVVQVVKRGTISCVGDYPTVYPVQPIKKYSPEQIKALEAQMKAQGKL